MNSTAPEVRELYNQYRPPRYAVRTVKTLLRTVPDKYLQGLECVVLTNQSGQSRSQRLGKVTSRKRRILKGNVIGFYHPAGRESPAWIELFVDKLELAAYRYSWLPIAREAIFGYVLFHEVGHHIHATVAPEYKEKEDVAENWRRKLTKNFLRKKYWFLIPFRKSLSKILKALAESA
jgi:hypothetical protein